MGRPSSRARSRAVRDWRRRSQEDVQRKEGMQRHHMPQEKEVLLCQEDQGEGPQEVHFLQTCVLPVWARLLRQRVQTRAHLRKRQLLNRSSSSNTLLGWSNPHGWCGLKSTLPGLTYLQAILLRSWSERRKKQYYAFLKLMFMLNVIVMS